MNLDELRGSLMPKLEKLILMVDPAINFKERKIQMNIEVQKKVGKTTATLVCLFCLDKGDKDKKKYIQFDVPPNSTTGYWNPTNFKKHLQKKHMNPASVTQISNKLSVKGGDNTSKASANGLRNTVRVSKNKLMNGGDTTTTTPEKGVFFSLYYTITAFGQ